MDYHVQRLQNEREAILQTLQQLRGRVKRIQQNSIRERREKYGEGIQ